MTQITPDMIKRICNFSDDLEMTLLGEIKTSPEWEKQRHENPYIAIMAIGDIIVEALMTCSNKQKTKKQINDMLTESLLEQDIINQINPKNRFKEADIRRDFEKALNNAHKGTDLSHILMYAFSQKDIASLAKIHHDRPDLREKIEALLQDCNFHAEVCDFCDHRYDKYLASAT